MNVEEGRDWRLVVDASRQPFPLLLGGPLWAAEFTAAEALAMHSGVTRLVEQHRQLQASLMAEEAIRLELELPLAGEAGAGSLWLGLEGDRSRWGLRFVLSPDDAARRSLEGGWPAAAAAAVAEAIGRLELESLTPAP